MRIGRVLQLVGLNIVLIVCAWLGILLVTAVAADVFSWARARWPPTDIRITLPNYPDKERAGRLFADYKKTIEEYVPFVGWQRLPLTTEFASIGEDGIRMHRAGPENNDRDTVTIGL
jgi:hypothetical protein